MYNTCKYDYVCINLYIAILIAMLICHESVLILLSVFLIVSAKCTGAHCIAYKCIHILYMYVCIEGNTYIHSYSCSYLVTTAAHRKQSCTTPGLFDFVSHNFHVKRLRIKTATPTDRIG